MAICELAVRNNAVRAFRRGTKQPCARNIRLRGFKEEFDCKSHYLAAISKIMFYSNQTFILCVSLLVKANANDKQMP